MTTSRWEELAWTGFLQFRLTDRHGLLTRVRCGPPCRSALSIFLLPSKRTVLPAPALAIVALTWALLLGVAPFFKCLIGIVYLHTDAALAVAIPHGSFNACASTTLTTGGWQCIPAAVVATLAVAVALSTGRRVPEPSGRRQNSPVVPVPASEGEGR